MIRVDLDVQVEPIAFAKAFKTPPGDMQAIREAVKQDIVENLQYQYEEERFIRVVGHRRNRRSGKGKT